jgi:CRP/FNR family cyclic AMP-dependent transcriptional regulator
MEGNLTVEKRAEFLEDVRWLRDCDYHDLKTLAQYLSMARHSSGDVIYPEGAQRRAISIIAKGRVKILKTVGSEQKQLAILNEGKTFGEMSMLDGQPASASVVAVNGVLLLELDHSRYEEMEEAHPRVAIMLLTALGKMMSARLRQTSGRLAEHLT